MGKQVFSSAKKSIYTKNINTILIYNYHAPYRIAGKVCVVDRQGK